MPKDISIARYSRQTLAVGKASQQKIRSLSLGIIGLGGIGGFSAVLCAQMGVKRIVAADMDVVDASNLGRQILYSHEDLGKLKAEVAKGKLEKINLDVKIDTFAEIIDSENIGKFFKPCGTILDCTDNYETRVAIDEYCRKRKIPWIYAGAIGTEAMARLVLPTGKSFAQWAKKPTGKFTCAQVGVVNAACGMAAAMQIGKMVAFANGKKSAKLDYFKF